jgi:dihydroxyacetone kinase DhaKLM complex PTS-EIIA-like component DhaM
VTWGPVIAGAFTALAISMVLLALGSGLGLLSVSPWSNSGTTAATFSVMTAIWLIVVQWLSSGFGGYLTGRLRTKWVDLHTDEVYFRDTAHGFLAWALASVIAVAIVSSAATSVIGSGLQAIGSGAASAVQGASQGAAQGAAGNPSGSANAMSYFTDTLFRSDQPNSDNAQNTQREASRILVTGLKNGGLSPDDRTYLAKLVAARTGLSQEDAEKRVDTVVDMAKDAEMKARMAADAARKAAAYLAFFVALSMMVGAFIAAAAAALGGHHRDEWSASLVR